jgi:L-seryl-tRNA(Ser) seleniumtransferase
MPVLMVHFVGVPPGTADLLIRFAPPETLARFGGATRYSAASDAVLSRFGLLLRDPPAIRKLLLGNAG